MDDREKFIKSLKINRGYFLPIDLITNRPLYIVDVWKNSRPEVLIEFAQPTGKNIFKHSCK